MENGEFFTSNQEATMDLVSKMSPLSEAKMSENVPKNPVIYMLTRGCVLQLVFAQWVFLSRLEFISSKKIISFLPILGDGNTIPILFEFQSRKL